VEPSSDVGLSALEEKVNALVPLKVKSEGEENSGDDGEVNADEDEKS
jgi:hypothetical protein